jgi:CRP/FNR family transcriptional regulator, cyclic AMP receptor protein
MGKMANPASSSAELFKRLASKLTTHQYQKGQMIFAQGDTADAMFRISEGNVKLAVASKLNKKAAISILREGDCFGEGCMVGNALRPCTATSIRQSTIERVGKKTMVQRLQQPAVAKLFTDHLLLRIGRAEDDLADQRVNSSERRLARLLLHLCEFGELSGHAHGAVKIDQATLAEMVGTTRSRVSQFMNEFRKKGFIDYNGSLHVNESLLSFLRYES